MGAWEKSEIQASTNFNQSKHSPTTQNPTLEEPFREYSGRAHLFFTDIFIKKSDSCTKHIRCLETPITFNYEYY
jgi:hypothetical protein